MISVCMATYNGACFIREQIDSILSQLGMEDELIISDDRSTDGTLEILAEYAAADMRVRVLHHEKKKSQSSYRNFRYATENFENALRHAKGEYIFLSDQDDIWVSDKVAICMNLFKSYDCIVHNYKIIDENGNLIETMHFKRKPIHDSLFFNIIDNHFRGCCMALKADILKYILPISEKVVGHDYWIGCIASHYMNVYYEMKPLISSRWYSNSVSAKRRTSLYYKLAYRLALCIAVLQRIQEKRGMV